ncbi:MAG: NAD(P)H-dependent oxidoreductase [Pseudomonadota bacterium]|nr:NAD(P)H-dependent oxidoreductase [Pseudomonadota bacterium]
MGKNIALILGNSDDESFCAAIAETYAAAAEEAGHQVRYFKLGDIEFDPVLRHGYKQRQTLEPGLESIREAILWSDHLVLVYPIWWGSIPAVLKGMFDRVFLPGFAFKYRDNSQFWDRLLAGRSAHAIATMDTPPWYFKLVYCSPAHHQMRKTILEFSGIKPVKITSFGPVRYASDAKRAGWLGRVRRFAQAA